MKVKVLWLQWCSTKRRGINHMGWPSTKQRFKRPRREQSSRTIDNYTMEGTSKQSRSLFLVQEAVQVNTQQPSNHIAASVNYQQPQ